MTPAPPSAPRPIAVHLDLKGLPPSDDRLIELLGFFRHAGYNAVLVEWEDAFPWTVDKRFRSPTAYTPDTVRRFVDRAAELKLELIPLVQCLGHMETPLSIPDYAHLRETPDMCDCLNPLADGARELIRAMVDDVLALMPGVRHLHLGGDEAWAFATHPDTKAYAQKHGKDHLYLQHVEPLLDHLIVNDIQPLLWHDMMIDWTDDALRALGQKAQLVAWGYEGHPDHVDHHYNTRYFQRFHGLGLPLWAAGAFKGADGMSRDLPVIEERELNARAWMDLDQRFQFHGLIATGWTRYATHSVQVEPIDGALDALLRVGHIFNSNDHGTDTDKALQQTGELETWQQCSRALKSLAGARHKAWSDIQVHRENAAADHTAPPGCVAAINQITRKWIEKSLARLRDAEADVRSALKGMTADRWIDEYLKSRIQPIVKDVEALNPQPADRA